MRRQHATANSRNFRSLAFPRRNSSITVGSVQASHSASVMDSLLNQEQVHYPTTTNMRTRLSQMVQDVGVVAARLFQSIRKDSESCGVKFARGQRALLISGCGQGGHGRRSPIRVNGN